MLDVTYISVDGVRSAVHDTRPGTKSDAIVFVHGNPGPMDDFESLIPAAAELGRVVALDLPGFGRADRPKVFAFKWRGTPSTLGASSIGSGSSAPTSYCTTSVVASACSTQRLTPHAWRA